MKISLSLRKIRLIIFIVALVILAGGFGYWLGKRELRIKNYELRVAPSVKKELPPDKKNLDFSLFWEVWERLEASYLDKTALKPTKMIQGAIKGMVASLGDPYTTFLLPKENKKVKEDLNGSFEGVGIQLGFLNGNLAVIAPLKGMPAEKAGVKAGDLILKIEEKETVGMSLPEAVELIRGPKGTKIKLTLLHQGEKEPYEVEITRATIVVPSVEVEFITNAKCKKKNAKCLVAHLKLMRFGERTREEWRKAVEEIKKNKVRGIVLDLRNNPGGYLSGSVFIASEFLSGGVVVQQEQAGGKRETFSVNRRGRLVSEPLVVLVNRGSASASEIVAGALQEHQRAKILGERTFGKGTIQEAQDLSGGFGLHITTARWLLPNGDSIDKKGIVPDNEVKDDPDTEKDEQLEKAIEILAKM